MSKRIIKLVTDYKSATSKFESGIIKQTLLTMIIQKKFIIIFLSFSNLVFSQSNYFLKPVEHPLFSSINSDYYYLIRATFLKNINPTLAVLKTSHLPESILYVSENNSEFTVNYKSAKSSIWEKHYDNSKKSIDVNFWKKRIDNQSYELLVELFNFNLYNTKFDPDYKECYDGEQYLFTCQRKTCFIEDVAENSNISKTLEVIDKIILEVKSQTIKGIAFSIELQHEIKKIIESNNK